MCTICAITNCFHHHNCRRKLFTTQLMEQSRNCLFRVIEQSRLNNNQNKHDCYIKLLDEIFRVHINLNSYKHLAKI